MNVYYFAYGSNMKDAEIRNTINDYKEREKARLANHKVVFNKYGKKRKGGVADIIKSAGNTVDGVLYTINEKQLEKLDKREKLYQRIPDVIVKTESGNREAVTYTIKEKNDFVKPTNEYINIIIEGLIEKGYGKEAIDKIEKAAKGEQ